MSINCIMLSCRNRHSGDFSPAVIPIFDIDSIATPDKQDADQLKGIGAIIFFRKETRQAAKPSGGALSELMGKLDELQGASIRSSMSTLETPVEIYKKWANACMGIIDTAIPLTLTQQQAIDRLPKQESENAPTV